MATPRTPFLFPAGLSQEHGHQGIKQGSHWGRSLVVCPKVTRSHLRTREATPGICPREWKTASSRPWNTHAHCGSRRKRRWSVSCQRTDGWMDGAGRSGLCAPWTSTQPRKDQRTNTGEAVGEAQKHSAAWKPSDPKVTAATPLGRSAQSRQTARGERGRRVPREGSGRGGHGVSSRLKEVPGSRSMWCLHSLAHALNATKWFPFKDLMRLLGTLSSGERKETRRRPPPTPRSPLLSGGEYPAPPPLRGSRGRGAPPTCSRGLGCWQSSPGVWLCRAGPPIPGKFASL